MGFVTYLLFEAISAAGSLIDVFGGFSLAQGFDPLGLNSTTVFGNLHQMLATMLLFVTNGHLLVIGGLLSTFRFLPVGAGPDLHGGTDVLMTAFRMFFVTAVQIALPMIAVLFLADLGLALLTKVAPQLNAINVMFPAKIGLTLLLVGLSFPVLPGADGAPRGLRQPGDGRARRAGGARMAGEKTEKATPKRRKEARKEGQVARTPELGGWATMLLLGLALPTLLGHELDAWPPDDARPSPRPRTPRPPSRSGCSVRVLAHVLQSPGRPGVDGDGRRCRVRRRAGRVRPGHQVGQAEPVQAQPAQGGQARSSARRSPGRASRSWSRAPLVALIVYARDQGPDAARRRPRADGRGGRRGPHQRARPDPHRGAGRARAWPPPTTPCSGAGSASRPG